MVAAAAAAATTSSESSQQIKIAFVKPGIFPTKLVKFSNTMTHNLQHTEKMKSALRFKVF